MAEIIVAANTQAQACLLRWFTSPQALSMDDNWLCPFVSFPLDNIL